jgi:HlyD family secretion protein
MKKTIKTIVWCVVGLFVVYTFYFLWKQSQPEPEVYELITPQKRNICKSTVATGALSPRKQVDVKPQITGIITKVLVKPGQQVKVGQELVHIRVIPDMNQLNNAQTAIESAK